jgi:hypothetical protein
MLLENLIYGTFPDLPGSQHVVHKTSGITPQIEAELLNFYNDFGDCRNEHFAGSLTVHPVKGGSDEPLTAISKVSQQGKDFSGRWGALLRHSAIVSRRQYQMLLYDPAPLDKLLRSGGTAAELGGIGDLTVASPTDPQLFLAELPQLPFGDLKDNLGRLMSGKRLVLYSEINTAQTNLYLRRLINLLPFSFKCSLSWSEFLFRPSEEIDVALYYSGRYEAPSGPTPPFTDSGDNSFSRLQLHPEFVDDYLALMEAALSERDIARLSELICDLPA